MAAEGLKKQYLLDDYMLPHAKSDKEILAWAKADSSFAHGERFDYARIERIRIDDKSLLILLAGRPMATTRREIFVYVGGNRGWSLLLWRYTNTAEVKIEVDKTSKQLVFRSKAGKRLLVLPTENIELMPNDTEQ